MSLTPDQQKDYRDMNKRFTTVRGNKVRYMDDDEKFIKYVWNQRKAYLRNHGRADEIDDDTSLM